MPQFVEFAVYCNSSFCGGDLLLVIGPQGSTNVLHGLQVGEIRCKRQGFEKFCLAEQNINTAQAREIL